MMTCKAEWSATGAARGGKQELSGKQLLLDIAELQHQMHSNSGLQCARELLAKPLGVLRERASRPA
jgi:hypothetical protein